MADEADLSAKLRDSEQRAALLESIMESMGESVLLVDRDGKEIYGNKELRRFRGETSPGADKNAWRQPKVMKIFDAERRELPPEDWPVARALRGDYKTNFEIRVQGMAHSPDEVTLAISTRSLVDSSGRVEGAVIVTRDITAVRQTEEKLRQSQKLETIGQLTGGVAHDFNNMLAAILSSVEVLKRNLEGAGKLEFAANTIEKAALRGADLTRHLLAFARRQTLQPAAVDVNALVIETLQLLRPALEASIEVSVDAPQQVHALADASQLTSALLNLCINARDAMGARGGKLEVAIAPMTISHDPEAVLSFGDYVRLSVTDTGCGMSPETIRRAVEPFFTTKGVGKGSGLGLSMAFGFTRQSGGDLRIESHEERGTTISLILPRAAAASPSAPAPSVAPIGKLRVLVVDDDELVRDALTLQLNDEGFIAAACEDGPSALKRLEADAFDVLLTDMVMPHGMSGVDLASVAAQRWPNMRIIISTGYAEKKIGRGDEGWSLLRKPYTSAELFAALRAAVLG